MRASMTEGEKAYVSHAGVNMLRACACAHLMVDYEATRWAMYLYGWGSMAL
jgi:hypothetical protein